MPLVERDDLLATLLRVVELGSGSHGQIVLLSGEAGAGRTRLLTEFVRSLPPGNLAAWGSCDALSEPRPLGALHDIASVLGPQFRKLLRSSPGTEDIFSGLAAAMDDLADRCVLVIDDVQWADAGTTDLLKFLCRRMSKRRVLIVISYRNEDLRAGQPLAELIGECPSSITTRLSLPRLTPAGVELLASYCGLSSAGLFELTDGNPFLVTELLSQPPQVDPHAIPSGVADWTRMELSKLTADQRNWITAVASINGAGRPLLDVIEQAVGSFDPQEISPVMLLENSEGTVRFRHELVRRAVLSLLSPSQRRRLFSMILELLLADPPRAESHCELVAYYAVGAQRPAEAVEFGRHAAAQLARLGKYADAISCVSNLLPFSSKIAAELAAGLYEDWANLKELFSGTSDEVIEARRQAAQLWISASKPEQAGTLYLSIWRDCWRCGDVESAREMLDQAQEILERVGPVAATSGTYSARSRIALAADCAGQAAEWAERAKRIAEQIGDRPAEVKARALLASAMLVMGDPGADEAAQRCIALATEHECLGELCCLYAVRAELCISQRKLIEAETFIRQGLEYAGRSECDGWSAYLIGRKACLRLDQGRLADAEVDAREVLDRSGLPAAAQLPASVAVGIAHARRKFGCARSRLQETLRTAREFADVRSAIAAGVGLVECAFLNGHEDDAVAQLQDLLATERTLSSSDADALLIWIHRLGMNVPDPMMATPGSPEALEMAGNFSEAVAVFDALGLPWPAAMIRLAEARIGASQDFVEVIGRFQEIGAAAGEDCARRIASERGFSGVLPSKKRGPYFVARNHPLGLTAREIEVLRMLVSGAGNRQIAKRTNRSLRTIEHHVSAVLAKLNAENRVQAALRAIAEPWILDSPVVGSSDTDPQTTS